MRLSRLTSTYLEGQGDLVSRLITGMIRLNIWVTRVVNLFTKSPQPSKYREHTDTDSSATKCKYIGMWQPVDMGRCGLQKKSEWCASNSSARREGKMGTMYIGIAGNAFQNTYNMVSIIGMSQHHSPFHILPVKYISSSPTNTQQDSEVSEALFDRHGTSTAATDD